MNPFQQTENFTGRTVTSTCRLRASVSVQYILDFGSGPGSALVPCNCARNKTAQRQRRIPRRHCPETSRTPLSHQRFYRKREDRLVGGRGFIASGDVYRELGIHKGRSGPRLAPFPCKMIALAAVATAVDAATTSAAAAPVDREASLGEGVVHALH